MNISVLYLMLSNGAKSQYEGMTTDEDWERLERPSPGDSLSPFP